jgi:hypothetical protein
VIKPKIVYPCGGRIWLGAIGVPFALSAAFLRGGVQVPFALDLHHPINDELDQVRECIQPLLHDLFKYFVCECTY